MYRVNLIKQSIPEISRNTPNYPITAIYYSNHTSSVNDMVGIIKNYVFDQTTQVKDFIYDAHIQSLLCKHFGYDYVYITSHFKEMLSNHRVVLIDDFDKFCRYDGVLYQMVCNFLEELYSDMLTPTILFVKGKRKIPKEDSYFKLIDFNILNQEPILKHLCIC